MSQRDQGRPPAGRTVPIACAWSFSRPMPRVSRTYPISRTISAPESVWRVKLFVMAAEKRRFFSLALGT